MEFVEMYVQGEAGPYKNTNLFWVLCVPTFFFAAASIWV